MLMGWSGREWEPPDAPALCSGENRFKGSRRRDCREMIAVVLTGDAGGPN